ncbi:MAG: TIGR03936 family radical SAM-associated protein [Nitrospirota bacterium]
MSRGCSKGCRFCQAGIIYRPLRERSVENILSLSDKTLLNTGYEEISFSSLNTGDYSNLIPLLRTFNTLCSGYNAAISLPSLRVGSVSKSLLKEIKSVRKTGFTIAPEAGTQRMRSVINKDVTEEEYKETLEMLFTEGWKNIKLYFMIGLPTETEKDIEGIISMAETALIKGRKIAGRRVNINVGISAFVPKAHTPFQWFGQEAYEELRAKQSLLRKAFSKKGVNFKGQHVELSLLEAVISRGGTECAGLIETAWKSGCRFDGWSETFDFSKWQNASEKTGIDLYGYASRTLDISTALPWDFIDTGVTKEFLKSEYQKALKEITTPDCMHTCSACGLGCKDRDQGSGVRLLTTDNRQPKTNLSPITHYPSPIKIRVRFSKTGVLRYLSHSEVMTALLRAMRRAGITLTYSAGFHPHPKISFGPALPVGVEGINEYFDIELSPSVNMPDLLFEINACLPKGLEILAVTPIDKNKKSLNEFISRYEYEITIDKTMNESINSFMNLSNYHVTREEGAIDIRPLVETVNINNESLHLFLTDLPTARQACLTGKAGKNGTKVRLYEILKEILQKPVEKIQTIPIKRIRLYGYTDRGWTEP